jgi:hypothetical protein
LAASVVAAAMGLGSSPAQAAYPANGTFMGAVHFSHTCPDYPNRPGGIGVGVAFDGTYLWYTCIASGTSPDLLRADPKTGFVSATYNINNGLGAIAYDGHRNAIWAAAGGSITAGAIWLINLDASKHVTGSAIKFNAGGDVGNFDDGLAFDATDDTLYFKPDDSNPIHHYTTGGTKLADITGAAACNGNGTSGLAIGGDLLFEGKNGCSHVYVVDKITHLPAFDFSTTVAGDPNFRDEGLSCDNVTFSPVNVMWSKEAYAPMRASAFAIPLATCGQGGNPTTTLKTSLTGGGQSGANITVPQGTAVHDSATLTGANSGVATGTVSYKVYSDNVCTVLVASGGTKNVTTGVVPDSDPVTLTTIGTVYWLAKYSGDSNNSPSDSGCGAETEIVSDGSISAQGTIFNATEGTSFTTTVAMFTDPDTTAPASQYSATIDWGDGSTSAGTISGGAGTFAVSGTHTYAEEGQYHLTVTITDSDNLPNTATVSSTANVADAALTASPACSALSSLSYNGATATFTDAASPFGTLSDFSATIDWGDGTVTAGTVTGAAGGPYTVGGAHTYATTGIFTITTTIHDVGGSMAMTSCNTLGFAFAPGGGSFVIGDQNAAVGTSVTFWGAQWAKKNPTSGGSAPRSFKGFAEDPTTPSCGVAWTTDPGNSTPPPDGPLPTFMAVIVTSFVDKDGSEISGNTIHIVVVKTNPGYASNPGHAGTGTVVAVVC